MLVRRLSWTSLVFPSLVFPGFSRAVCALHAQVDCRRSSRRSRAGILMFKLYLLRRESSRLVNETELVAERIAAVEALLSPRLRLDGSRDGAFELTLDTSEALFEVINGEVNMLRTWLRIPRVAVGTRIEASKNALPAAEVMPPRGDAAARLIEHRRVVDSRLINVGNRHNHAKQSSRGHVQE